MKYALWIVSVPLAFVFLAAGSFKLLMPVAYLADQPPMAWVSAVPPWMVKFIGLAEVAGALGLILPAATRILPQLTPTAANGLALVMALAVALHVSRGEIDAVGTPVVLFALAAFVPYGRTKLVPVAPRGT
jgi:uncharacterized membrane protein YphA (DoxX/SURF4 family)